jgi:hypothetical protein
MQNVESFSVQPGKIVDSYFGLIQNLSYEDKIELIAKISNSLLRNIKENAAVKTKEEILKETYGCFESEKTADEIIDEIYNSRHFSDKEYTL